ncbi:MAG: hypothetical protein IPH83_20355 [Gammaproteobacteria bacterium]|nr:hypothetical protein [Gammaproteobacteria bacterium]
MVITIDQLVGVRDRQSNEPFRTLAGLNTAPGRPGKGLGERDGGFARACVGRLHAGSRQSAVARARDWPQEAVSPGLPGSSHGRAAGQAIRDAARHS